MNNSLVIYNVRLVDEELDFNGAIFAANGKIIRVLKGDFSKRITVDKETAENSIKSLNTMLSLS